YCPPEHDTSTHTPLAFPTFPFTDPPTTDIYHLSVHDGLPISAPVDGRLLEAAGGGATGDCAGRRLSQPRPLALFLDGHLADRTRSEEHTSELQSPYDLVCRLLLEKKNIKTNTHPMQTNYSIAT